MKSSIFRFLDEFSDQPREGAIRWRKRKFQLVIYLDVRIYRSDDIWKKYSKPNFGKILLSFGFRRCKSLYHTFTNISHQLPG